MGNFDDREQKDAAVKMVGELDAEVATLKNELEQLHSWDGLMELLDEHWPEDLIPTRWPDIEGRDTGPRIVSLIRWVNRLSGLDGVNDAAKCIRLERQVAELQSGLPIVLVDEQQIRDAKADALEEAAIDIVLTPVAEWKRHGNRGIRENAEAAASAWLDARADEYRKAGN